jgi:hypothetical protein
MKKNRILIPAFALMAFATIFTGCDKEDEDTPPPTPSTEQMLSIHMHTKVGNQLANYNTVYTDASGRKFNISDFRYYISNIILIKSDNSEYPISGKVLLINPNDDLYNLAKVPVGSYKGFKFTLGLDSATNHMDPATYPSSDPLSIQTPSIHWSWNSGYIFLKMEGLCDTTLAANGTPDYQYFFDCGLDQNKRLIDFSNDAFTVTSGQDLELAMDFRVLDLLNNVDLRTENSTHTMDNMPLATKIMDNASQSFNLE